MITSIKEYYSDEINEKIIKINHKSGLRILYIPKESATTHALLASCCGGIDSEIYDSSGKRIVFPYGMAHFLEHKLFANPDGSDTCEKFNRLGADCNAFTSCNTTAYLFSCRNENVLSALDVLVKSYFTPFFTIENVKNEASIISEEVKMYRDEPYDTLYYAMLKGMFKNPSLRISPCGTLSSVKSITPEMLTQFYNYFYTPSNTIMTLCGSVDINELIKIADRAVPPCNSSVATTHVDYDEPPHVIRKSISIKRNIPIPQFSLGIKLPYSYSDGHSQIKLDMSYSLICDNYFSGSNKFINDFYERGDVASPIKYSFDSFGKNIAIISFDGEAEDSYNIAKKIKKYILGLSESPVTPERLETLKRIAFSRYIRIFDSIPETANELLAFARTDSDIFDVPGVLKEIDADFLNNLVKNSFSNNNICIALLKRKDSD